MNGEITPAGLVCCHGEAPAPAANSCSDAAVMNIAASDYDQSCQSDADCVGVPQGNLCADCTPYCNTAAVNHAAEAQYRADISDIVGMRAHLTCHCPAGFTPCCMAGKCSANPACSMPHD